MSKATLKNILTELRRGLSDILGDGLVAVFLFGSRARHDARPASDIDVLVVVHGELDYPDLIRRTSHLVSDLSLKYDAMISRAFISKDRFEREQTPFLLNVRREAVAI